MKLLVFLLAFFLGIYQDANAYMKCGGKIYWGSSPKQFKCCGGRMTYKTSTFSACCGQRSYNPSAQQCCGGKPFEKADVNSGCCYGKFYQRGVKSCCGQKLIDLKTEGCCRNEPFKKAYESCCDGIRTPNLLFNTNVRPECCGKILHNPAMTICCAGKTAPKIAGIFTKCCKASTYDMRRESCCGEKPVRRTPGRDKCCFGKMMDSRVNICCDYGIKERTYGKQTGCCRMGLWKYQLFNEETNICCSRNIGVRKAGAATSCCNQQAYNVKTEICCNLNVFTRTPGKNERCCGNDVYDRSISICCDKRMKKLTLGAERYTFCCGDKSYDRRKFECVYDAENVKYILKSLNREVQSGKKPIG